MTDLVFEHAALTPSRRIAESVSNILIDAGKQNVRLLR